MAKILIVDDEAAQRNIVGSILRSEGHEIAEAGTAVAALPLVNDFRPNVILTDLKMPGKSGLELVEEVRALPTPPEVVVITAFGSIETAVKTMRAGAYDYLTKPIERDELVMVVSRAAEKYSLRMNGLQLQSELARQVSHGLIAESAVMKQLLQIAHRVAQSDATVLIRGDTGTGKERIARLIHYSSPRGNRPLQTINCAAFPETLLESELFGYEKGSFTGANARKIGIMEAASGGTLFLDEVADMSLNTQAKVLRALQEREVRRVGGTENIRVDIRIIAATNKNLEECIKKGLFRDDLYYRLNVIPIIIPPLHERKEDIAPLVNACLSRRGRPREISAQALRLLCSYRWPGNVRELEAVMERVAILSNGQVIDVDDLPPEIKGTSAPVITDGFSLPAGGVVFEELERDLLKQALERSSGVIAEAARLMGMTYRTFQYRAEKFGLLQQSASEGAGPA
jgi:DNA-binding NtrC family response regulator